MDDKKKKVKVAIIGTAGRDEHAPQLTAKLYHKMKELCDGIICMIFELDPNNVVLISGGAAWSDHIAVDLFNEGRYPSLTLYLPAPWDFDKRRYKETNSACARVANRYHDGFSQATDRKTLREIDQAIMHSAIAIDYDGFVERNTVIANECQYLIAFTWAENETSIVGGTHDTWEKCKITSNKKKVHISLLHIK